MNAEDLKDWKGRGGMNIPRNIIEDAKPELGMRCKHCRHFVSKEQNSYATGECWVAAYAPPLGWTGLTGAFEVDPDHSCPHFES
jgi:hypothetical protein